MLAIFAEMGCSFIRELAIACLAAAMARNYKGGRPKATDSKQAAQAQTLRKSGHSAPDISKALGVSIPTAYRITKAPTKA